MNLLCTYDFPPQHGGIARYHHALVDALAPECTVFVADRCMHWLRLLPALRRHARNGVQRVWTSEPLPIGTVAMLHRYWTGIPYTVICHGLDLGRAQQYFRKRIVLRRVLRGAAHVVVNSAHTAERAVRAGADATQIRIIHPPVGITPEAYPSDRGAQVRDTHQLQERFLVCTVGRLVRRKGFDVLIQAIAELSRLHALDRKPTLAILGDGPEREALTLQAEQLQVDVRWIPHASDATIAAWYAACDVFAMLPRELPDGDVEGFGIVYLEAGAFGKPVIGARSGGVPDAVLDGVTGILVAPDDPFAAAQALFDIAQHPERGDALGRAGRTRVREHFTLARFRGDVRELLS
ncbi:glycosyltransferase family 4 protein [Candidatus Uhrbacteria bacterium]|nr:glycosyltransferase family 4 protein [Candidatus Uhrbacteria bacterium]